MDLGTTGLALASAALVLGIAAVHLLRRHRRQRRDAAALAELLLGLGDGARTEVLDGAVTVFLRGGDGDFVGLVVRSLEASR